MTLEVNIETKFTGDHEHGFDTVAEIPGTDPKLKDQVVMVGGHLDSWISGTGATDNGGGLGRCDGGGAHSEGAGHQAEADDPHRAVVGRGAGPVRLAGLREAALRNVRRAGASGPGRFLAFMRQRGKLTTTKEWETLDAYYNLDNGTGKVRGVYTQENYAIAPIFAQWIAPLQ